MGTDQFCSQQGTMGAMHTPLERLQIVSVGSLQHQGTSTRMVHDEYTKEPEGKIMYAYQGPRDEPAIFAIASSVYSLQKFCLGIVRTECCIGIPYLFANASCAALRSRAANYSSISIIFNVKNHQQAVAAFDVIAKIASCWY